MTVYNVWFWAPFHMLQAYPMARNLPLPDFMIPFVHLIWVPFYIWEHWTGLAEPVEEAWAMKSIIVPLSGIVLLSFFYFTHKMSEKPTVVKVGAVLYFAFMFFSKNLGFQGSPKKIYVRLEVIYQFIWNFRYLCCDNTFSIYFSHTISHLNRRNKSRRTLIPTGTINICFFISIILSSFGL